MPELRLLPFERDELPLAEPWFQDADTNRWLGGPRWPRLMLDLASRPLGEYRGAAETGMHNWLAWERDTAVGYIDCGTCDRWTTWDGAPGGRGLVSAIEVPSASLSYVVDPALRRRGHGTAMITAVMAMPELAHIELFAAGVEPANAASVRCLRKAGFAPLDPEPDWEGIVYYTSPALQGSPGGDPFGRLAGDLGDAVIVFVVVQRGRPCISAVAAMIRSGRRKWRCWLLAASWRCTSMARSMAGVLTSIHRCARGSSGRI